ncbi:flagellin [Alicyclobacillus sp. SP_1]|uniref:flagellin N-terminal helical domain-containing protein n=1 Tax=Alicyclobacillus sp. SP_1 TaxID=2942475 RepID=UPI0021577C14|nr:flagellin [Alicyclobacillus sp. SP_1]
MQITQQMMTQSFLYNITNDNQRMQSLENELSTGKVLNMPEDNPLAVSQDMSVRATLSQTSGYENTISAGLTWMNSTSSALNQVISSLQSIQSYVVEAMNSTNQTSSSEEALGETIKQLAGGIYQSLNTTQGSRYLFGGTLPLSAPVSSSAADSTGFSVSSSATGNLQLEVSSSINVTINVTADQIMNTAPNGTSDTLQSTLDGLVTQLSSGNANQSTMSSLLSSLQENLSNVVNANADVGARIKRLTSLQSQMSQYSTVLTNYKGDLEDANMAQVITQFNTDQSVFTAALKMGSEVLLPSLVSFLPNG